MGLIWALLHAPAQGLAALTEVEAGDLEGLGSRAILEQARSLQEWPPSALPEALFERLNKQEVGLVEEIGRHKQSPGDPAECVRALKRMRYDRERAEVQRQIDRLQEAGAAHHEHEIIALWDRKKALVQRIESLIAD